MRVKIEGNTDLAFHIADEARRSGIGVGKHLYNYGIRVFEVEEPGITIACNTKSALLPALLWNLQEVVVGLAYIKLAFRDNDREFEITLQKNDEKYMEWITKALIRSLNQVVVRSRLF